jgi:hypothetical protein
MRGFIRLAVACALFGVSPASATFITVTYTGTIESGADPSNIFATGRSSLADQAFTLLFFFDTTKGSFGPNSVLEGPGAGEAILAVNGHSVAFSGSETTLDAVFQQNGVWAGVTQWVFDAENGIRTNAVDVFVNMAGLSPDILVPLGPLNLLTQATSVSGDFTFGDATGRLAPTMLNVTEFTPGISEPSTWALLLIGFAGIGFASYRRKAAMVGILLQRTQFLRSR